jgi:hypothetical protein
MAKDKQLAKVQAAVAREVEQIQSLIARHGWTVLSRERQANFPAFSYTVGLVDKGLPELVILGLDMDSSREALNRLANRMVAGEQLADGARLKEIIPLFPVEVRALSKPTAEKYLRYANLFAKRRPWNAFQVFWPDPAGYFPSDEFFDRQWLKLQPVLDQLNAPPASQRH